MDSILRPFPLFRPRFRDGGFPAYCHPGPRRLPARSAPGRILIRDAGVFLLILGWLDRGKFLPHLGFQGFNLCPGGGLRLLLVGDLQLLDVRHVRDGILKIGHAHVSAPSSTGALDRERRYYTTRSCCQAANLPRKRNIALVCSWEIRDSVTPRIFPISFRVRSS